MLPKNCRGLHKAPQRSAEKQDIAAESECKVVLYNATESKCICEKVRLFGESHSQLRVVWSSRLHGKRLRREPWEPTFNFPFSEDHSGDLFFDGVRGLTNKSIFQLMLYDDMCFDITAHSPSQDRVEYARPTVSRQVLNGFQC